MIELKPKYKSMEDIPDGSEYDAVLHLFNKIGGDIVDRLDKCGITKDKFQTQREKLILARVVFAEIAEKIEKNLNCKMSKFNLRFGEDEWELEGELGFIFPEKNREITFELPKA